MSSVVISDTAARDQENFSPEAPSAPPPATAPPSTLPVHPPAAPVAAPRLSYRVGVLRAALVAAVWGLPLLRPAGPGNTGPVDIAVAIAVLAAALWISGHGHRIRMPYGFPVGLSVLAGSVAALVAYTGAYVSVGGSLLALVQDVFLFLWALSIVNVSRVPALLRTVSRAWSISSVWWAAVMIIGVLAHISALSGVTPRTGVRASLTLGDPNLAANYFICSLFVLRAARYPRRRLLRWLCCALILAAIAFTGSNGGAIVLIGATLLGCLFTLTRRRGLAPAVMVAAAAALFALAVLPHVHLQSIAYKAQTSLPLLRDSIGRQAESSGSRSTILTQTVKLYFDDDNLIGLGPSGVKGALKARHFSYVKMAHDDYAAALVERGVLGAVALVILVIIVLTRCRRIATRPLRRSYAGVFPRPELLGAGVAAMFMSAFLYQVLHFRHVWLLFGLVAAVDLWGRQDHDSDTLDPPDVPGMRVAFQDRLWRLRRINVGRARIARPAADPGPAGSRQRNRFRALAPAVTANVMARVIALASLALATILVARAGGPKLVGEFTLLRVLPGLAGVLAACGLPAAVPFFLARQESNVARPRLWTTLVALTLAGSLLASACWLALGPVLHMLFFRLWGIGVVIASAVPVFTQLWVAVGKSFLQGENDMRGANWAIAAEEAAFLPVYLILLPFMHGTAILMSALVASDLLVAVAICVRLARRGLLRQWGKPDIRLAAAICRYGLRGQIGSMLSLVNLRLDVAILGALAGPGVLGVYAVASKFAELLRLPGLAITYVLYPRLALQDPAEAGRRVAAMLPRAFGLTVLAAVPLAAAVPLLPMIYGHAFNSAVIPTYLLLAGLVGEGVAGVVSAYLYGVGRPGANSLGLGVAVIVTVVLDVLLIPHFHAVGAAFASSAAYLTSSAALVACYVVVRRTFRAAAEQNAEGTP
jgi:O-antigen/teichoic acid export membrane protein/O-antigen ligase